MYGVFTVCSQFPGEYQLFTASPDGATVLSTATVPPGCMTAWFFLGPSVAQAAVAAVASVKGSDQRCWS